MGFWKPVTMNERSGMEIDRRFCAGHRAAVDWNIIPLKISNDRHLRLQFAPFVEVWFGLILVGVTFLNVMSARLATRIQTFFFGAKMAALAMIIIGGIYKLATGKLPLLIEDSSAFRAEQCDKDVLDSHRFLNTSLPHPETQVKLSNQIRKLRFFQ